MDAADPGPGADLHGRSAVMIDRLVERHAPDAWPVTAVLEDGADPRRVRQHDGGPPTLLSRRDWAAVPTHETALVDVRTGRTLPARVYRIERRTGV